MNLRITYFHVLSLAAALVIAHDRPASAAVAFDAGADLIANMGGTPTNGYGVWEYGSSSNSTGAGFTLLPDAGSVPSTNTLVRGWFDLATSSLPQLLVNTDASPQVLCCGITALDPGQLLLHGQAVNRYADLKFTAPAAGQYEINALMERLHSNEGDMHVVVNGTTVFSVNLDGSPQTASYLNTFALAVGDTVEITAGLGVGGNLNSNSLGLDLVITQISVVPEPGASALLGLGAVGLAWRLRRRRTGL